MDEQAEIEQRLEKGKENDKKSAEVAEKWMIERHNYKQQRKELITGLLPSHPNQSSDQDQDQDQDQDHPSLSSESVFDPIYRPHILHILPILHVLHIRI